jgi:ABC-type uncharacterized transport system auxiliary subunit
MNYFVAFLALIGLSACTVTQPYVNEYKIKTETMQESLSANSCKDKMLKVSQAFSPNALMTKKMRYTQGDFSEYVFSESEWSQSPNAAITQEVIRSVRASKLFQSVQGYKSRSKSDYILESSIEEFIQHFSSDSKSSYVTIVISFTLVDVESSQPIATRTLSEKVTVDEMSAKGGVKAFNIALSNLFFQKNKWLNEVCR